MGYVDRYIALDEVTTDFLKSLRAKRKNLKLTQQELADLCDIDAGSISHYEHGRSLPSVHTLMVLAAVLGVDLSGSINHRYYYGHIGVYDIMRGMKRYGLNWSEMGRILGYNGSHVKRAVMLKSGAALDCVVQVLDVLDTERKKEKIRK